VSVSCPQVPDLVPLELEEYDHLITKRKMEEGDKCAAL
jgi:hypothetical protein